MSETLQVLSITMATALAFYSGSYKCTELPWKNSASQLSTYSELILIFSSADLSVSTSQLSFIVCHPLSSVPPQLYFRLLQNWWPDPHQTWWGCTLVVFYQVCTNGQTLIVFGFCLFVHKGVQWLQSLYQLNPC